MSGEATANPLGGPSGTSSFQWQQGLKPLMAKMQEMGIPSMPKSQMRPGKTGAQPPPGGGNLGASAQGFKPMSGSGGGDAELMRLLAQLGRR